ncbi:MAG: DNA polymerase III subunit epsilon [Maricaulaceae bacterium]
MREIVFDTETTGLNPNKGDRITEIGCVEVINYIPTGRQFHRYINPERDIPAEVVKITGLTYDFLKDKPKFSEICDEFLDFVSGDRLVAHNANFDKGFVNAELGRQSIPPFADERFFDTLELARTMFPGAYNSLDALCNRFNINLDKRDKHGALIDAELLASVYLELNGGRERRLSFDAPVKCEGSPDTVPAPLTRPHALPPRLTDAERNAHAAFVQTLGETAVWRRFFDA